MEGPEGPEGCRDLWLHSSQKHAKQGGPFLTVAGGKQGHRHRSRQFSWVPRKARRRPRAPHPQSEVHRRGLGLLLSLLLDRALEAGTGRPRAGCPPPGLSHRLLPELTLQPSFPHGGSRGNTVDKSPFAGGFWGNALVLATLDQAFGGTGFWVGSRLLPAHNALPSSSGLRHPERVSRSGPRTLCSPGSAGTCRGCPPRTQHTSRAGGSVSPLHSRTFSAFLSSVICLYSVSP